MTKSEYWSMIIVLAILASVIWGTWIASRWAYDRKREKDDAPYLDEFDKFYEACRDWHRAVPMTEDARVETDRRLHAAITDFIKVEEADRAREPVKK